MNVNDLKKSKFLTKNDVEPAILVTIESCEEVNVAKEGAEPEYRWAMHFKDMDKPLILNSTNGQIIAAITGSNEDSGWIGKKIVLYNEPTISFGGKITGGIRVRAPRNVVPAKPTPPQARGLNPNGTKLPANFNPNTDAPDEMPPAQEPDNSGIPF
ncbi:MAG: hypothetical protein WC356_02150 [Candidatus Micrarchaeia archaeon]|jgi:hypothetical protein